MFATGESHLARLKKLGERILRGESGKTNVKAQPIPPDVAAERRSGRRVCLSLDVRIKLGDADPEKARIRDVNLTGLAVEPDFGVRPGDVVRVGFDGKKGVAPGFALAAVVKRAIEPERSESPESPESPEAEAGPRAMGLEIDREKTSAEAQKNFRRLIRHYLHHRPAP